MNETYCLAPIPITFEPHWADKWMVGVTAGSAVISFVLALVAITSALQARNIALQAERSEVARTTEKNAEREFNERAEVAELLARSLRVLEYSRQTKRVVIRMRKKPPTVDPSGVLQRQIALSSSTIAQFNDTVLDTATKISLLKDQNESIALERWRRSVMRTLKTITIKGNSETKEFLDLRNEGLAAISSWMHGKLEVCDLPDFESLNKVGNSHQSENAPDELAEIIPPEREND